MFMSIFYILYTIIIKARDTKVKTTPTIPGTVPDLCLQQKRPSISFRLPLPVGLINNCFLISLKTLKFKSVNAVLTQYHSQQLEKSLIYDSYSAPPIFPSVCCMWYWSWLDLTSSASKVDNSWVLTDRACKSIRWEFRSFINIIFSHQITIILLVNCQQQQQQ